MDLVSALALVFAFVAAVASVVAALAAIQAITLTRTFQHEARMGRLADALIAVEAAAGQHPPYNARRDLSTAGRYKPFDDAIRDLKQADALSIPGLSADVTDPVVALLEEDASHDPKFALSNARTASEHLNRQRALPEPGLWSPLRSWRSH